MTVARVVGWCWALVRANFGEDETVDGGCGFWLREKSVPLTLFYQCYFMLPPMLFRDSIVW